MTLSSAVFVVLNSYFIKLMWFFEFFFLGLCPDWIRELWGSTDCYILNEWCWTSYTNYHCWLGLQQWILCQWNDEKKEYKVCIYTSFFFLRNYWVMIYICRKKSFAKLQTMREFPLAMVNMHLGDFKKRRDKRNGEIYFIFLWLVTLRKWMLEGIEWR